MLTISKPTLFGSDGMAERGQCNHDSPGWHLRWFDPEQPAVTVWQGAYKTCRHLQMNSTEVTTLEEAKQAIADLLASHGGTPIANQPTDAYPAARDDGQLRRRRKKKRH